MMDVALLTVKDAAAVPPKLTAVALVKLVPVIVTMVPPESGPAFGDIEEIAGPAMKANRLALLVALAPPGVATMISTVPTPPGGDTAVIDVGLLSVKDVAGVAPKLTELVPVKFVPLIVTLVPPEAGPLFGEMDATVGAAT